MSPVTLAPPLVEGTVSIGSGSGCSTPLPPRECTFAVALAPPVAGPVVLVLVDDPFGPGTTPSLLVFCFFFLRSFSFVRLAACCGSGAILLACVDAFPPYPLLPDELLPLWRDFELPLKEGKMSNRRLATNVWRNVG
uniref:Uncharacterized protein n=1 Tax=Anopheles culicifacies TaxID=139723 RepID=A0A182M7D5_9DIPT